MKWIPNEQLFQNLPERNPGAASAVESPSVAVEAETSVPSEPVEPPEPATHVLWNYTIPYIGGVPLTEEKARNLWSFLVGGSYVDWRDLAERYPENRDAHLRSAANQDDDIKGAAIAFLCYAKRFLGDAAPGLTLHLLDGRVADPVSLDLREARRCMGLR